MPRPDPYLVVAPRGWGHRAYGVRAWLADTWSAGLGQSGNERPLYRANGPARLRALDSRDVIATSLDTCALAAAAVALAARRQAPSGHAAHYGAVLRQRVLRQVGHDVAGGVASYHAVWVGLHLPAAKVGGGSALSVVPLHLYDSLPVGADGVVVAPPLRTGGFSALFALLEKAYVTAMRAGLDELALDLDDAGNEAAQSASGHALSALTGRPSWVAALSGQTADALRHRLHQWAPRHALLVTFAGAPGEVLELGARDRVIAHVPYAVTAVHDDGVALYDVLRNGVGRIDYGAPTWWEAAQVTPAVELVQGARHAETRQRAGDALAEPTPAALRCSFAALAAHGHLVYGSAVPDPQRLGRELGCRLLASVRQGCGALAGAAPALAGVERGLAEWRWEVLCAGQPGAGGPLREGLRLWRGATLLLDLQRDATDGDYRHASWPDGPPATLIRHLVALVGTGAAPRPAAS